MKQLLIIIGSVAAAVTGAAFFLFQYCKKERHLPIMKFIDLYRDNNGGETIWS